MIWVIGSTGMLGAELCRAAQKERLALVATASEVDVRDFKALKEFCDKCETNNYLESHKAQGQRAKIEWIVNCSAYTAVEKAEKEKDAAAELNVDGAKNIARVARNCGARLIHISTDYVFDGTASVPYDEDAAKRPLGVYGRTKSLGEDEIQKTMTQFFILRTSWLYGFGRPNFVTTMARLMSERPQISVVSDQRGTPTFTADLADVILRIIRISDKVGTDIFRKDAIPYGIYNYSGAGETTWYGFALEIQRLLKKHRRLQNECSVNPCTAEEFGAKVERPAYSVLSKEKIAAAMKIKIPKWQESLERYIKDPRFEF